MDRNQMLQALQSAQAARMAQPEGSPGWQACLDEELALRHRLSMGPPESTHGAPPGRHANTPDGHKEVPSGYFDDVDDISGVDRRYKQDHTKVDPRFLDNRESIDSPGHFRHDNIVDGGGGNAVPEAPPPPPAPESNGKASRSRQPSMKRPPPPPPTPEYIPPPGGGMGGLASKIPVRLQFRDPKQFVGWAVTAGTLVYAGYRLYRDRKGS